MIVIGSGSVVQRDKTRPRSRCRDWELSVVVRDGTKRCRKARRFHGTYTQAQSALHDFIAELQGQEVGQDATVAEYFAAWTRRREASGAYSARTIQTDREKMAGLLMHLGDALIRDLSPEAIEDAYQSLMAGESPSGRAWGAQTVRRAHTVLSKMLHDAEADGLGASCMRRVRQPKAKGSAGKAMPPQMVDSVLASLDLSQPMHRAVALALGCGLRRGEIAALEWSDVTDAVTVSKSMDDSGAVKCPKTGKSRTVPLPPVLLPMTAHAAAGSVCGCLPHSITQWWYRNRDALGCGEYRFHDLRHSYATRLAASGVHMRVAMELCGWSSVEMASRVYTHVSSDMARAAVLGAFS